MVCISFASSERINLLFDPRLQRAASHLRGGLCLSVCDPRSLNPADASLAGKFPGLRVLACHEPIAGGADPQVMPGAQGYRLADALPDEVWHHDQMRPRDRFGGRPDQGFLTAPLAAIAGCF